MISSVLDHARRHSIAYLALTCSILALSGASYAAFHIPNGAVGERQLKNYAIDPVKWNPAYVTGFVRRWANVNAAGSTVSSAPNGQSAMRASGFYYVTWDDAFASFCAPIATVTTTKPGPTITPRTGAYAETSILTHPGAATWVEVDTFNAQGQPTPEAFSVAVVCPPGAGSGTTYPTTLTPVAYSRVGPRP